jgi:N utilization substance protein A
MAIDIDALIALATEKNIPIDLLILQLEKSVLEVYRKEEGAVPGAFPFFDRTTGEMKLFGRNGEERYEINPPNFERLVNSTIRKDLKTKIRAAKDLEVVAELSANVGDLITGEVQQGRDETIIYVKLARAEGKVPPQEQVKGEIYKHGDLIKAYVVEVKQGEKGPDILLSRTHPLFVKSLFALEVPEIRSGVVDIIAVAREPGERSKVSVRSNREGVSAKGALIGPGGARSKIVTDELHGEKIDIVDFDQDIAKYVAAALAPARVISAELVDPITKAVKVVVPDYQLSLAIGKNGQNARLAARLTGAKIDIHPDKELPRILTPEQIAKAAAKEAERQAAELAAEQGETPSDFQGESS